MRLVVSSDWHGDWSTLGVSRFEEVERAVEESVLAAIERKADAYLCLGDIADPDNGGATLRAVALATRTAVRLSHAGIPSIWVAGNHDVCEDGTGESTMAPLQALSPWAKAGVHVFEQPGVVWLADDLAVLALPFMPVSHGVDIAMMAASLWPTLHTDADNKLVPAAPRVIVASHLTVPGVMPGEETSEMPRGREVAYPFEATTRAVMRLQGHYHRRQQFDPGDGGPPIVIPGSLARLTFGEEDHDPSFLVVDV